MTRAAGRNFPRPGVITIPAPTAPPAPEAPARMQLDLTHHRVTPAEARALLARHYGRDVSVTPLAAEKDQLFDVTDTAGGRYILKIAHPTETDGAATLQLGVLLHLETTAPDVPVQRVIRAVDGAPGVRITDAAGAGRNLRLVTYLDGALFRHNRAGLAQARALGRGWAGLGRHLAGFEHPDLHLPSVWDIREAGQTRAALDGLPDPARRTRLAALHDRLAPRIAAGLAPLPVQAVHGDFSGDNLLVDAADPDRLGGILDFGDLAAAPLICDVAIAAADLLEGGADPLARATAFVAAYAAVHPLSAAERGLIFDLMLMRLFQRLAIAEIRAAANPENRAYLTRNTERLWLRLAELEGLDPAAAATRFTETGDPEQ